MSITISSSYSVIVNVRVVLKELLLLTNYYF